MKEFLIKITILAVIVIAIVVLVRKFSGPSERPKNKSFQDVVAEDDRRLRADIEEPQQISERSSEEAKQIEQQAREVQEQHEEIPIEDQVQAQRLFEMALAQRKMARLPGITYKLMVDYCREIIQKYPNSPEAPKARRMLGEVPERYREIYNITDEEMGI
jgi:TolA-binding protein